MNIKERTLILHNKYHKTLMLYQIKTYKLPLIFIFISGKILLVKNPLLSSQVSGKNIEG